MIPMSADFAEERNSTGRNQREIPILGLTSKPGIVDWSLIAKCQDEQEALLLCVHLSKLANEEIAHRLGIDKGHWTRIMQGRGNLPARKRTQLMATCGNLAPVQFDCLRFGLKVREDEDLDAQEQKKMAELAQIRRAKELRVAA